MLRFACLCGALTLVLLGAATGCGGGAASGDEAGPDPEPTPLTTLRGEYRILLLTATTDSTGVADAHAAVGVGTATSDGRGVLAIMTETYTTDLGHVSPRPDPDPDLLGYTESADRALTVRTDVSSTDAPVASGYVSADGEVALLAMSYEDQRPGLLILARSVTSATSDDFAAKYHSLTWAVSYDATSRGTASGVTTIKSSGAAVDTITLSNTDGIPWSGSQSLTGAWSWAPDGTFDVLYSGDVYDFEGGLCCSDPVILCGGSFTAGDGPGVRTYLQRGGGPRTLADFAGSYYAVGLIWRPDDDHYVGFWGALSPDGAGNVSRSFGTNDEGAIGLAFPATSTYSLSTGGVLTIGLGPYGHCTGALAETGHIAFLGGGTNAGDPVSIVAVMRR